MTMRERSEAVLGVMNRTGASQPEALAILGLEAPPVEPAGPPSSDEGMSYLGQLPGATAQTGQDLVQGAGRIYDRVTGDGDFEGTGEELGEDVGPTEAQREGQQERFQDRQDRRDAGELSAAGQFAGDLGDTIVNAAPQLGASVAGGLSGNIAARAAGRLAKRLPGPLGAMAKVAEPLITKAATAFGALAPNAMMAYEEGYQKAIEQGLDPNDSDVQKRIDTQAGLRTMVETVAPLAILRKYGADAAVQRSLKAAAGKEGAKLFSLEGSMEVADMAIQELFLDEELRSRLSDEDKTALMPWITERYGRDAALGALAGGTLGASIDAPGATMQQKATNAKLAEDTRKLATTLEPLGVDMGAIEAKTKTAEGVAELRDAVNEIGRSETARAMEKKAVEGAESAEDVELAGAIVEDANARADATIDKWAEKFGAPMRTKDLQKVQADRAREQRKAAMERLRKYGETAPADADVQTMTNVANTLDKAEAEVEQQSRRLESTQDPELRIETQSKLDAAREDARKARIDAKMKLQGKNYDQASKDVEREAKVSEEDRRREEQRAGRERAIERQMELEMPETMPEAQRKARAQEIIDEDLAQPRNDKGLETKINRLQRKRRAATTDADIDRLTNEIADLEARRGLPTPAVEAARRVLQASGEQSPTGVEESSPDAAQAPAGDAQQARSAKPQDAGREPVGAPAALDGDVGEMNPFPGLTGNDPDAISDALASAENISNGVANDQNRATFRAALGEEGVTLSDADLPQRASQAVDASRAMQAQAARQESAPGPARRAARRVTRSLTDTSGYDLPGGTPYRDLTAEYDPGTDLYDFMRTQAADGIEVAAHRRGDEVLAVGTNDNENTVMPPRNGFADSEVTFIHTHTLDTPFSASDIRAMLHSGQPFVALLPNGENLSMRPLGVWDARSEAQLNDLFSQIGQRTPRDLSALDRARIRQEALLQLMEINGNIDYDRPLQDLSEQHMEIVNDIVSDLEGALPGDGARSDAGSRPATDVPDGGQARPAGAADAAIAATSEDGLITDPDDIDAEFSDIGVGGILENQTQRRERRKRKPDFNPERVRQLVQDTIAARAARRRKAKWYDDYKAGRLTEDGIQRGIERAIELDGMKKAMVIPEVTRAMYPDLGLTEADFERKIRKQSGSTRDNKPYRRLVADNKEQKFGAALDLMNDVRNTGHGAFGRQINDMSKGWLAYKTFFHEVSQDLKDFVEFKYPDTATFYPPVADANDVSRIKRDPRGMRFSEDAMAPLKRTAKYLQANEYTIDKEKLYALEPDDLISGKAYGAFGFGSDDVAQLDVLLDAPRSKWTKEEQAKFSDEGVKKFIEARKTAAYKLGQMREAYADFASNYGEDGKVGFLYQVDRRGRIYADGSFHPQAGSSIKSVFKHEGVSLGDMTEVDNAASGWQVNALIARDHVAAPRLNMGAGQATEPGFSKQDLYTDTLENLRGLMKRDAAIDPSTVTGLKARRKAESKKRMAQAFLDGPFRDGTDIPISRTAIKPAIIAINYGGKTKNFQDIAIKNLSRYVQDSPRLKPEDTPYGYIANLGLESLTQTAPHAMAFQQWAIDSVAKTVAAVEAGSSKTDPPQVEISIGLDGRFAEKKYSRLDGQLRARSTKDAGQLSFKMKNRSPVVGEDGNLIPIMNPDGTQAVKEEGVEVPLKVNRDEVHPERTGRAYFANLIQSFDAAILHRAVERYKQATNGAYITTNHDSFTVPPEHEGAISAAVRESMASVMSEVDVPARLYADLKAAAARAGVEVDIQPFDGMGTYNMDDLSSASPLFGEAPGRPDDFVPQYDELPPSEPFLRAGTDEEPAAVPGEPTPLYAARTVQNGDEIKAWAEAQGLPVTVPTNEMHVTTAYSREPVDVANVPPDESGRATRGQVTGQVTKMGDALVLELPPNTLGLAQDHQRYRDAGATYDFPRYRPHITLAYDAGDVDLSNVPEFSGALRVGPEDQRVLGPDDDGGPGDSGTTPRTPIPSRASDFFGAVQDAPDASRAYVAPPPVRENWATKYQRQSNTPGNDDKWMNKIGRWFERKVVSDQMALTQIERKLGVGGALIHEGMSRLTQMLTNEQSRINLAFYHAPPKWDKDALVMRADNGVKPLADIFKFTSPEDYSKFSQYAYARRDEGIIARGEKGARIVDSLREQWLDVSPDDKARYDAMLEDYRAFNNSMLNLMEDASLISAEQKQAMLEDGEYVPMFRVFEDSAEFGLDEYFGKTGGMSHPDPGIRSLKDNPLKIGETVYNDDGTVRASGGQFGDLLSNIQKSTVAAIVASNQNIAHQRIYDFMSGRLGHEAGDIETKTGVKATTLTDRDKKTAQRAGETDAVMFYRNGQPVYWRFEGDEEMTSGLMMALAGLKPEQLAALDRGLLAFQGFQRTVITSTPNFALASLQRDVGQAYIQSDTRPLNIVRQNVKSFGEAFSGESREAMDLMMGAGVGGYQYQAERDVRTQDLLQRSGGSRRTYMDRGRQALKSYERALGSTEIGVRKAVYDRMIAQGMTEADALYEARNHIDYGRKGASKTLRRFMRALLFVNPRIQGLYRIFETTTGDRKERVLGLTTSLAARGMVYMGIAMGVRALTAMDEEDEEAYMDIPVEQRHRALHFAIPGTGRFFEWEHPFELGAMFGAMPVQMIDSINGRADWGDTGRLVAHTFMETFSLNITPEVIKPVFEVALNHVFFLGMPIEGMGLEALPKEFRSDARTGGLAKALGNKQLSPVELQHLVEGYLGPLGMFFYDQVEQQVANMGILDQKTQRDVGVFGDLPPAGRMTADFFAGRFFSKTDTERNVAATREFFQFHRKIREATAFVNLRAEAGRFDEARDYVMENKEMLRLKPLFNAAENEARKIRRQMRVMMDNPNISEIEKERRAGEFQRTLNMIYRKTVERAEQQGLDKGFLSGVRGR